jgi:hypothetical protein
VDCGKWESEKAESVAVVLVCWDPMMDPELFENDFSLIVDPTAFELGVEDDATLEISAAPGFNVLLLKEILLKALVCSGCCCGDGCSLLS